MLRAAHLLESDFSLIGLEFIFTAEDSCAGVNLLVDCESYRSWLIFWNLASHYPSWSPRGSSLLLSEAHSLELGFSLSLSH